MQLRMRPRRRPRQQWSPSPAPSVARKTCFEKCRGVGFTADYCNNWNVKCGDAGVNCFASFVCSTKDVNACLASTGGKSDTKKGPCNYE